MEIIHLEAVVHGRVLAVRRNETRLLVGFHGYAETAEIHAAELAMLPGVEEWSALAVQALHPFYLRSGQSVGASWMTSLDRELAIEDNLNYIRTVLNQFPNRQRLVFAGFSQGASMAWRAAAAIGCHGLIALGGDLPDDALPNALQVPSALIARGERDEWYDEQKLKKDLKSLEGHPSLEVLRFAGGHEWTDEFRQVAGRFLSSLG